MLYDPIAWAAAAGAVLVVGFLLLRSRQRQLPSRRDEPNVWPPSALARVGSATPRHAAPQHAPLPSASPRWISANQQIIVAGTTITDGMVYVGHPAPSAGAKLDNCVIDPALPVAATAYGSTGLHYWPSYASLTAAGRRGYIDWLARGRSDVSVDIGFVFLFFYGLERRLFVDQAWTDALALIGEVERLLTIHGGNNSFHNYAGAFLDAARVLAGSEPRTDPQPDAVSFELPLALRVHIGRLLASGSTIDARSALAWVLATPETRLRAPARRCFDELKRLWALRFATPVAERAAEAMRHDRPPFRISPAGRRVPVFNTGSLLVHAPHDRAQGHVR